jgi:hypothetical protein
MIIGKDLLQSLAINLLFDKAENTWDNDKSMYKPPEVLKECGVEPQWSTKAGCFKVRKKCAQTLLTFHENQKIVCNTYVDESDYTSCNNNMIIGETSCIY